MAKNLSAERLAFTAFIVAMAALVLYVGSVFVFVL